ncbi:bifunctional alpha,alpha-trehalose-phosphate synthase (UDP-forming)/trehalose-phosphatase [uncultured Bacteroides sp.]|uniref:bifunctional alpha,alpha-trehalose-phosphate synthase (UDP-forming)/trehalose-phosphatase n=1 Tax=uncultured Bacteroides sp. TaxID=162156 RepID=UPI002AA76AB0|nr:bifunctional alpha,alpha-trehalose-phosphate synthase (UDP-forming)/trehalose-phosphatase [uncultured Bacteroides sp.]
MRLFIISNRLPLKANRTDSNDFEFSRSEGGLATGLGSLSMEVEKHWIGWPGLYTESEDEKEMITNYLQPYNFHPVFLSPKQIQNFYEGYSNSTLWPLCHYFYAFIEYDNKFRESYKQVNELFCQVALPLVQPGDIVWVQDYHLMLLPQLLRTSTKDVSIGYFHHIPFPSYELFRVLPERADLLNGLLGADLIGFHTHDYMRHFVSTAERVLDLRFKLDQVLLENRIACVDAFPMGINYSLYHDAILNPDVQQKADILKKNYGTHKLILSVDRLDYSKGILHRLRGFALFLERHPEYKERVSLAMIIVPSRGTVGRYASLKIKIDESIGAINGKYSTINWTPVYYFYRSFDFEELVAMYHIADIALVTPLRDGMNLVAKEYLAVKRDTPGVLILSEMAGAAIELGEAIIVNPNDVGEIEHAILKALEMPVDEQLRKLRLMQEDISKQTVDKWATDFVNQVKKIKSLNEALYRKRIKGNVFKQIQIKYRDAGKRLLILDYDGTLCAFKSNPEDAFPTPELMEILKQLCANKKNKVVISSGRDHQTLDRWFSRLPIDLAAEHGAFYKEEGMWHENVQPDQWDEEIISILQSFIDKTPHSKLEEKETALVWHYRNVDAWLASLREQQLINALIGPCARQNLQIMRGDKIVEIKSPLYTKGSEARRILQNDKFDFILAMGDDITDEDTFRELPNDAFTIKIGNISEVARFSLLSQSEALPFLKLLISK